MISKNIARIGNFTSSGIVALNATGKQANGFGVAAITYISETNMERFLGRSLDTEVSAKPLSWGRLLEPRPFEQLGLAYTLTSQETDMHPTVDYWSGSKDGTREGKDRAVIDLKCPITPKSFCQLVLPLYHNMEGMDAMNAIRFGWTDDNGINYEKHKDGEKYYYQLVSNAIINNVDFAELIVYMPYESELDEIKLMASDAGDGSYYWIWGAKEGELPYLPDNGFFRSLNIIRFEVPQADKDLLTANVEKAGKMLVSRQSITQHLKTAA